MAKKKHYDDDDGRVIASMNVEGMPWYVEDHKRKQERLKNNDFNDLSKEETRAIIWGIVKSGLLIAGVFLVAALIFILFCIYIWFR